MPYSNGFMKDAIKQHFLKNIPSTLKILDAGAGCGTYSKLLKADFPNMDGIEIFSTYNDMFDLKSQYNNLFIQNVLDFDITPYDYIILGDIIEHMKVVEARNFLDKIESMDKICLVGVPYNFPQEPEFGNEYEKHLQPDLTEDLFLERYPNMTLLFGNHEYGYFVNYEYEKL